MVTIWTTMKIKDWIRPWIRRKRFAIIQSNIKMKSQPWVFLSPFLFLFSFLCSLSPPMRLVGCNTARSVWRLLSFLLHLRRFYFSLQCCGAALLSFMLHVKQRRKITISKKNSKYCRQMTDIQILWSSYFALRYYNSIFW